MLKYIPYNEVPKDWRGVTLFANYHPREMYFRVVPAPKSMDELDEKIQNLKHDLKRWPRGFTNMHVQDEDGAICIIFDSDRLTHEQVRELAAKLPW